MVKAINKTETTHNKIKEAKQSVKAAENAKTKTDKKADEKVKEAEEDAEEWFLYFSS